MLSVPSRRVGRWRGVPGGWCYAYAYVVTVGADAFGGFGAVGREGDGDAVMGVERAWVGLVCVCSEQWGM
jgi:hypothetical protein